MAGILKFNNVEVLDSNANYIGTIGGNASFPNKNFFVSAWVVFDGTSDTGNNKSQTILDSLNVTSVTRSGTGTGVFVVNLSITMANSNYLILGGANGNGSNHSKAQYDNAYGTIGTNSFGIRVSDVSGNFQNVAYTTIIVVGDR